MLRLTLKEAVASGTETLPHLIRVTTRYGTHLLPLRLQSNQLLGCVLPVLAVLQRLGSLANLLLELEVVLHLALHTLIELTLCLEETVASRTETVVDACVVLLWGEAYCTPYLLNLNQSLACLVPLLA